MTASLKENTVTVLIAAEIAGVHPSTIYRILKKDGIPGARRNKKGIWEIPPSGLNHWIDNGNHQSGPERVNSETV